MNNQTLKNMDVEAIAQAIEADAGHAIPDLRESLRQAREGEYGAAQKDNDPVGKKS